MPDRDFEWLEVHLRAKKGALPHARTPANTLGRTSAMRLLASRMCEPTPSRLSSPSVRQPRGSTTGIE